MMHLAFRPIYVMLDTLGFRTKDRRLVVLEMMKIINTFNFFVHSRKSGERHRDVRSLWRSRLAVVNVFGGSRRHT